MRRHNIGRISAFIIFLNIIFCLIYLADKNGVSLQNSTETTEVEEVVQADMQITMDETVDGEYITMLENIISDKKYSNEELAAVKAYSWYLTDNINNSSNYIISDDEIVIYAADDNFVNYVNDVLSHIITA